MSHELADEMNKLDINEEVGTKNWNNLPWEMKEKVVKEMDFITRTCLKLCSKADKRLVESIPYHVVKFGNHRRAINYDIKGTHWDGMAESINRFRSGLPPGCSFEFEELKVSQMMRKVTIWRYNKKREIELRSEKKAVEMIEKLFHSFLMDKSIRFDELSTGWVLNTDIYPEGMLIKVNSIIINHLNAKECLKWLKHVAPGVEKIKVFNIENNVGVGELSVVQNAKSIAFRDTDITDEQLSNFKATHLSVRRTNATVVGVRELIKKWIDRDIIDKSFFKIHIQRGPNIEHIFDGYDIKVEENPHVMQLLTVEVSVRPNRFLLVQLFSIDGGFDITGCLKDRD